jgi:hypothetical protein
MSRPWSASSRRACLKTEKVNGRFIRDFFPFTAESW